MVTLIIVHVAKRLARFGKDVSETWREAKRLRRNLPGPTEAINNFAPVNSAMAFR